MQNMMMLYNPKSDSAVLSGGGWQPALPLSNLASRELYKVARSIDTSPANTQFRVVLNSLSSFKALVLGSTNLTTAYEYRIRCYNNPEFDPGTEDAGAPYGFTGLLYDSGWVKPFEGSGGGPLELEWEDPWFWLGAAPFDDADRGISLIHILPRAIEGMYWTFELDDFYNSAGHINIGRLFMPETYQPSLNYSPDGNGISFRDNSLSSSTLSGSTIKKRRVNPRVFQFGWQYLPESEAFGEVYRLMQVAGYDGEVFVVMDPDDAGTLQRRSMFGTISQMNPLQVAAMPTVASGFQVEEII